MHRRQSKTDRTVDFDYFRMWHLKWIEKFQGPLSPYLHVHFLFETSDFDRPTIRVNVSSKAEVTNGTRSWRSCCNSGWLVESGKHQFC
ncbi:UNVERIFIED_ORG: hypothetical protein ABIC43_004905 [Variovorax guangxiensis]